MVHEKCRSDSYTYRTGDGELEQVARFAVPEDKVGVSKVEKVGIACPVLRLTGTLSGQSTPLWNSQPHILWMLSGQIQSWERMGSAQSGTPWMAM